MNEDFPMHPSKDAAGAAIIACVVKNDECRIQNQSHQLRTKPVRSVHIYFFEGLANHNWDTNGLYITSVHGPYPSQKSQLESINSRAVTEIKSVEVC